MEGTSRPVVLDSFEALPAVQQQIAPALRRQALLIGEHAAGFVGREATIAALDALLGSGVRGVITLEGALGSGTTALLCHLAATRRYGWWLRQGDDHEGLAALCGQVVALCGLVPPLLSPVAGRDATVLEGLLASTTGSDPLVLLLDGWQQQAGDAFPALFPATLPPNVVLLCACEPDGTPPLAPAARLRLETNGPAIAQAMGAMLRQAGCPPHAARQLIAHSGGSFLYLELAQGLFELGLLDIDGPPEGLAALLAAWWAREAERPHAAEVLGMLAASSLPLPAPLLAALTAADLSRVEALLTSWWPLLTQDASGVALVHEAVRRFAVAVLGPAVGRAREQLVALALGQGGSRLKPATLHQALAAQLAETASLVQPPAGAALAVLLGHDWLAGRERLAGIARAAADACWVLRGVASVPLDLSLLVRAAVVAGTLSAASRTLEPESVAGAFLALVLPGATNAERSAALRSIQALVDQLPEGRGKAAVLRRLGEACYAREMRPSAMRLLSQALDMEDQAAPRSWQDEREQALAALSRAALAIGDTGGALEAAVRIGNAERRGMSETEVARALAAAGSLPRAEKTAAAISDDGMRGWALAEVAVAYARHGDEAAAEELLAQSGVLTAVAWARTELIGDLAAMNAQAALAALATLEPAAQQGRACGRAALVLAEQGQARDALKAAQLADDPVLRGEILIDLAPLVAPRAPQALAKALLAALGLLDSLAADERRPLVGGIAAALAACGQTEQAYRCLEQLGPGEEHARALGRIALALARHGNIAAAEAALAALDDDDERDWALTELARLRATSGEWLPASRYAGMITLDEQRDATLAELSWLLAQVSLPAAALELAERIDGQAEQARALTAVLAAFGATGDQPRAEQLLARLPDTNTRSKGHAALAAALAAVGQHTQALQLARNARRPLDQARALAEIARVASTTDPLLAQAALGEALRTVAPLGRSESLKMLELVASTLAILGGSTVIAAAAAAIDEIDDWWQH